MGKAFVIRYEMRPETADENQKLVENVFAELSANSPEGVRYASFRLDDGVTFVHVGMVDEGVNALAETAAFQEFQKTFGERAAGKPDVNGGTLLGAYGFDK